MFLLPANFLICVFFGEKDFLNKRLNVYLSSFNSQNSAHIMSFTLYRQSDVIKFLSHMQSYIWYLKFDIKVKTYRIIYPKYKHKQKCSCDALLFAVFLSNKTAAVSG